MNLIIRPISPRKPKTDQEVIEEQKQTMADNVENSEQESTQ